MIHPVTVSGQFGYVISSKDCWLPGIYDTERSARYALRFDVQVLEELQVEVNNREAVVSKRMITFEMLQQARRRLNNNKRSTK